MDARYLGRMVLGVLLSSSVVWSCADSGETIAPPPPPSGTPNPGPGDAGTSSPLDGAVSPSLSCGNGARDPGELCDGDEVDCGALSALYTAGPKARCRPSCSGYDVASCSFASDKQESVQPAVRDPSLWANAQCNTGGAFPLFVQRSPSKHWVIRLEGGGACSPVGGAPCYLRPPTLAAPVLDGKPIVDRATGNARRVDSVPAPFADANYALLNYCSSDVWTGTQTEQTMIPANAAGTKTMPWRFSGRFNVKAALEILAQRYGLDDADSETKVFFTGGSAGGHGVLHNLDQARVVLARTSAGKRLWAFANAASYFPGWRAGDATVDGDWSALDVSGVHTGLYWEDAMPMILNAWKADMGNAKCVAAFPGAPQTCFFASEIQRFIVDAEPNGLGIPLALANNLEDPNPQDEFGLIPKEGPRTFAPGGAAASKAWGDTHRIAADKLRWAFILRDPLGYHGVPFAVKGADTPTLQSLMDGFVSKGDPDPFSFVDFAPLPVPK